MTFFIIATTLITNVSMISLIFADWKEVLGGCHPVLGESIYNQMNRLGAIIHY
jgi:hypothetical protein